MESEGDRGLAAYLDNQLLARKIRCMNPTVESWHGELWGVLEIQSYGSLSEKELEAVKEYWQGQESDGWGEGFEQRPIQTRRESCMSASGIQEMTSLLLQRNS